MLFLGVVFIWSGLAKLRNPSGFAIIVATYQLTSAGQSAFIAAVLPVLETLGGICILTGVFVRGALAVTTLLILVFIFAQFDVLYRGLVVRCGCFGSQGETQVGTLTVARAFCLMLVAAAAYWLDCRKGSYQRGKTPLYTILTIPSS